MIPRTMGVFGRWSHVRALSFCAALLGLPWVCIYVAWARSALLDPWVISVVVFAAEVVLKVGLPPVPCCGPDGWCALRRR